ncbi:MAG: YjgP/YjgQ family permease [Spirochaetae bacterium HGW-Spirochaetae-8]|nr:MAG: YjgP/YjgQ family permease [Spirochaetae bacterium HGW-Spirochaetae-8]
MMKIDRYIISSIVKTTVVTVLLILFVLILFDVFSNVERYMSSDVSYLNIALLALYFAPQAVVLGLGPSLLFSTTYFLSSLHANNELIVLFNAGFSFKRIVIPCIFLGILLSGFLFIFNEQIAIPYAREKMLLTNEVFNIRTSYDNRNITLRSADGGYVLHAGRYYEKDDRITSVVVVMMDSKGRLSARIDATSGTYNGSYWVLQNATRYLLDIDGNVMDASKEKEYHNERLSLEPGLFRNLSADIKTMELNSAFQYLSRLKAIDSNQYAVFASDFYNRLLGSLTPLILIVISCSTIFNWKKNVLIFSIIASLCIAIIFYVLQMLSLILAKQSVIPPAMGTAIPMLVLLSFSFVAILYKRK